MEKYAKEINEKIFYIGECLFTSWEPFYYSMLADWSIVLLYEFNDFLFINSIVISMENRNEPEKSRHA